MNVKKIIAVLLSLMIISLLLPACRNNQHTNVEQYKTSSSNQNLSKVDIYNSTHEAITVSPSPNKSPENKTVLSPKVAGQAGIAVDFNSEDKRKVNIFLSSISEALTHDFNADAASDRELISFAVYHNYLNNKYSIETDPQDNIVKISENYIEASVLSYFNLRIKKHQSVGEYSYKNGYYTFPSGASISFLPVFQMTKIVPKSDNTYLVYGNIYSIDDLYKDDPYAPIENLSKYKTLKKAQALIQNIEDGESQRYILLKYEHVPAK
ncbi:MAG TPA: hypothetical protein VF941_09150 [Clostridia bacterium]